MPTLIEIMVTLLIIVMILGGIFFDLLSYQRRTKIFNEINKTNYTVMDFILAGDQINSNTQTIRLK